MDVSEKSASVMVNREELASFFKVSMPTIDRWIDDGLPVEQKGSNGRSYLIDVEAAVAWKSGRDTDLREADEAKQRRISELQEALDLDGGSVGDDQAVKIGHARAYYEADFLRNRAAKERRKLVVAKDVRRVNGQVLSFLTDRLQSLPDVLERRCTLSPEIVAMIATEIDAWQEVLADDLETALTTEDAE